MSNANQNSKKGGAGHRSSSKKYALRHGYKSGSKKRRVDGKWQRRTK